MRRRATAIWLTVFVAASLLGAAPVQAEFSDCRDFGATAYHTGQLGVGAALPNRYGIRAYIDPAAGAFGHCSAFMSTDDSSSAWVSIEPKSPPPENSWQIAQVGFILCNSNLFPACNGDSPRFFWAEGGCGLFSSPPDPQDLGIANWAVHEYAIRHHPTSNDFRLSIDGVNRKILPFTNNDIECWASGQRRVGWFGERADRGDSLGDENPSTSSLKFSSARYQSERDGIWRDANWTTGNSCLEHEANSGCEFYSTTGMYAWSDHIP